MSGFPSHPCGARPRPQKFMPSQSGVVILESPAVTVVGAVATEGGGAAGAGSTQPRNVDAGA